MYLHSVFNRCLASVVPFPELRRAKGVAPTWHLSVAPLQTRPSRGQLLGEAAECGCRVALFGEGGGYALYHDCTGVFEISTCGSRLLWRRREETPIEIGRADVLGRVLAVSMHAMGYVSLHASAVALNGCAIGFLAAKGAGKSTLAIALAAAGAHLITDDTLAVWPGSAPTVTEGIHGVRLNSDSASHLLLRSSYTSAGADGKHRVVRLPGGRAWTGEAPLGAIYLLTPGDSADAGAALARRQLPLRAATMLLTGHTKIGALLGRTHAASVLDRVASIVRSVPVYELTVPRDFSRLRDSAAELLSWHASERAA